MDDFKENNPGEEKEEPLSSTFDPNTEAVKNEMEKLAKTFQQELDKAKQEASSAEEDAPEILIQGLEDIPEKAEPNEPEEIPEDELCECCGEKRRGTYDDPDSCYCNDCDEGLRHYPFDFLKVFLTLAVLALVFYSGYTFAGNMNVFVAAQKADKLVAQNKITSAIEAYTDIANTLVKDKTSAVMLYKKEVTLAYRLGYMDDLSTLNQNFKDWELNLPHLKKVKDIFQDAENFTYTSQAINTMLSEYAVEEYKDLPYDEVIDRLTALEGTDIPATTATAAEDGEATTAASSVSAKKYNKAMIYYFKVFLARNCGKDIETQIKYAEQIKTECPEYSWMYAPVLCDLYSKTGQDITELLKLIRANDSEDYTADVYEINDLRIKGEYDAAIEKCDALIDTGSEIDYEFYRVKSLCYLAKGDYDSAFTVVEKAYEANSYSIDVIDTYAICAAILGKDDIYTQMQTTLIENGYDLSDSVKGFKDGTLTLDDILLKGDYDV